MKFVSIDNRTIQVLTKVAIIATLVSQLSYQNGNQLINYCFSKAIVFACLIAVAVASYARSGEKDATCFADRCETCKNHFKGNHAVFDCEGQCGLCALCNAATIPVVEGCRYCQDGIDKCIETCNKGKKICNYCANSCDL